MASKIRIHRSTGASAPSSLEFGELAATVEQGTAGTSANKAGRIFIGNVAGNPVEIGGEYTYKLLDHTPGELHLTSALVTDANANINGLRIAGIATITRTDITDAVTQNLRVTGVGTFVAGLDLNGNVTIGNAHTDILTINSRTGVSTDMTLNNGLKVVGLSTFSNAVDVNATTAFGDDVTFETQNTKNIDFDKSENDLTFGDNVTARFGDSNDLAIVHNGTNSMITNSTGALLHRGNDIRLQNAAGSEVMLDANADGAVNLYHNNNKKLETTATGLTITGTPVISNLTATRVPFVGSSKELVDNANFTFGSNVLNVVGRVDATDVDAGSNLRAVTGVVTNFTGSHNTLTDTVGTGATFTTTFRLGSGATDYSFPTARGFNDQILILNGSGVLAFEDVPGTLVISAGYAATDAVQLLPDVLTIAATTNETKTTLSDNTITVGLSTDIVVSGGATVSNNLHVIGNLKVDGTQTILNTIQVDVQDNTIGVASTSTASNTTANGAGFFVHGGGDGNKEILFNTVNSAFQVNQHWLPDADNTRDLGKSGQEWKDLFLDGTATIDTLTINDAASFDEGVDVTFNGASSKDMVWDSSAGALDFADNAKATFGASDDLQIFHDGSSTRIQDSYGHLNIGSNIIDLKTGNLGEVFLTAIANGAVTIRHDNNVKFTTKSDGVDVTGEVQCDSLDVDGDVDFDGGQVSFDATNNRLDFADDAKATFGDAQDLEIHHDQNNSVISNKTGSLFIKGLGGSGNAIVMQPVNNEMSAKFNPNAGVELFFDHSEKFETTAYGTNTIGTSETDTLIVTGVSTVASLIFSAGTNTNGVSYFDANGQVQSTVSPASGISTSNSILTTNASGVPIWTDTIDCGTF